jgi:hypothetical protein
MPGARRWRDRVGRVATEQRGVTSETADRPEHGTRIAGYAPVSDFAPALSCLGLRSKLLTPVAPAEGVLTLRSSGTRTRKILRFQI